MTILNRLGPGGLRPRPEAARCPTGGGRRQLLRFEPLESRQLMAVSIHEYPIPTPDSGATRITPGPDGNLWFVEQNVNKVARIDAKTHTVTSFTPPTPNSGVTSIIAGPDGNLWFTESAANKIGRINPMTFAITEFPLPTTDPNGGSVPVPNRDPIDIQSIPVDDPSLGFVGSLWFLENTVHQIATIDPGTGAVMEYNVPPPSAYTSPAYSHDLSGLAYSSLEGLFYFTQTSTKNTSPPAISPPHNAILEQFDPGTHAFTEIIGLATFPISPLVEADPRYLWFTNGGQIGQYVVGTSFVSLTDLPSPGARASTITPGPDAFLWFGETVPNGPTGTQVGKVGSIAPGDGSFTEYPLHSRQPHHQHHGRGRRNPLVPRRQPQSIRPDQGRPAGLATAHLAQPRALRSPLTFRVILSSFLSGSRDITGTVTFMIDGKAQRPVPVINDSNDGQSPYADFAAPNLAPGKHTVYAVYNGDSTYLPNTSDLVTQVVSYNPSVVLLRRTGVGPQPTRLTLTFDQPMNRQSVENLKNYLLYPVGPRGNARPFVRPVPIVSAVYDPSRNTVTLTTRSPLNPNAYYLLSANGAGPGGFVNVYGDRLLGTHGPGRAGGNYLALVHGYAPLSTPAPPPTPFLVGRS